MDLNRSQYLQTTEAYQSTQIVKLTDLLLPSSSTLEILFESIEEGEQRVVAWEAIVSKEFEDEQPSNEASREGDHGSSRHEIERQVETHRGFRAA